jgi:hypothetical protein
MGRFGWYAGAMVDLATAFLRRREALARVRSYLPDEDGIENVLLVHGKDLARFIFEQMKQHYWETPTD